MPFFLTFISHWPDASMIAFPSSPISHTHLLSHIHTNSNHTVRLYLNLWSYSSFILCPTFSLVFFIFFPIGLHIHITTFRFRSMSHIYLLSHTHRNFYAFSPLILFFIGPFFHMIAFSSSPISLTHFLSHTHSNSNHTVTCTRPGGLQSFLLGIENGNQVARGHDKYLVSFGNRWWAIKVNWITCRGDP